MDTEDILGIDLKMQQSYVRPEEMSGDDIAILNRVIASLDLPFGGMDPVPVIEYLYRKNIVDPSFYDEIIKRVFTLKQDRRDVSEYVLQEIPKKCSLESLTLALRETGYRNITRMILEDIALSKHSVNQIYRFDTSDRKNVQQFFKNLKRKVWNAEFEDPLSCLRSYAMQLSAFMKKETNVKKQCILADKIGAVLSAEIDAHAITFNTELSEHPLFNELKALIPNTSNTMVTDVVLYGRLANACAIGNHFKMAENYLRKAKSCSAFMTPCLEQANMVYCDVYVQLWKFEQNPQEETRLNLLKMAATGIQCLREEEDEEIRLLWTRMFLLRMVFCNLGIGNRATIIPNYNVTESGIIHAKEILAFLDQTTDNMDKRRKMFYSMARGRLYDLERNIPLAVKYVRMAAELAEKGNFKEKPFICKYMEELKLRKREESADRVWSSLDHSSIEHTSSSLQVVEHVNIYGFSRGDETIPMKIIETTETKSVHWSAINLPEVPPLELDSFSTHSAQNRSRHQVFKSNKGLRRSSWTKVKAGDVFVKTCLRRSSWPKVKADDVFAKTCLRRSSWPKVKAGDVFAKTCLRRLPWLEVKADDVFAKTYSNASGNNPGTRSIAHLSEVQTLNTQSFDSNSKSNKKASNNVKTKPCIAIAHNSSETDSYFKIDVESFGEVQKKIFARASDLEKQETNGITTVLERESTHEIGAWSIIDLPEVTALEVQSLNSD